MKVSRGQRIQAIQALRGIAAFAVVALHAIAVERKYSGGDTLLPGWLRFGDSGVDLFFVISGYVMVSVTRGRFGSVQESVRFLWSRATRIYPTFWFYFFVTLSVFLVRPSWVNSSMPEQANLLFSFLLLPDNRLPLVMVSWSLVQELWFYLVFTILLLFPEKALVPALCAWAVVVLVINLFMDTSCLTPGSRIMSHPYACEFILGGLAALIVRTTYVSRLPSRLLWALVLAAVIGVTQASATGTLGGSLVERALVSGALYAMLLVSSVVLEARRAIYIPRFLQLSGDMSYSVYLSHVLVLSVIGRIWLAIGPVRGLADNVVACVAMFSAVILYGWAGYRLIEKPMVDFAYKLRAGLPEKPA